MGKIARKGQAAVLTDAEIGKIWACLGRPHHRLFVAIARYTGERAGAICRLRIEDVYLTAGMPRTEILFRGENRKGATAENRLVPVSKALRDLLKVNAPLWDESGWLFPGKAEGQPMTLRNFDAVLRRACKKAGILKGVSTHSFRRTVTTNLIAKGKNPRAVQKFMGWSSLAQVMRYSEVSDQIMSELAESV